MKISKLFHWLYAFLMFLPIVLFIPNAFYYGFNEHATNSETTTINYKYQSNEVNSYDDLVEGNIYHFDELRLDIDDQFDGEYQFNILSCNGYTTLTGSISFLSEIYIGDYDANYDNLIWCYFNGTTLYLGISNLNGYIEYYYDDPLAIFDDLVIQIGEGFIDYLEYMDNNLPTYTDYNVIESVEINTNDTISNKMYQAWQSTWNLPLLQWTHTSFVAAPFTYITGLFGVPSDSTLNYIFAYFVSISICWLVFDLLMYVPNLAHRWLDRSALE